MKSNPGVIVFGLDGGTWDLLGPLMSDGIMPNLARIAKEGVTGDLRSTLPSYTPTAWSSFATGKNPGKHGVFGFTTIRENSQTRMWVSSKSIKTATLWKILSDHGLRVGLLNVPLTYPPEEVNGFVVSGFPAPENASEVTYPHELLSRMEANIGTYILNSNLDNSFWTGDKTKEEAFMGIERMRQMTLKRGKALFWLMDEYPTDLFMAVFVASDRIQHQFWKWLDPSCSYYHLPGAAEYREKISEVYGIIDRILGQVCDRMSGDQTLYVVSDHGFGPREKVFYTNKWLADLGLLRFKTGKRFLRAVCGKLGLWDSLPLTKLFPALAEMKQDPCIDWEKTVARGGRVDESGIYLNSTEGATGDQARAIVDRLLALKDPETGKPMVIDVLRREDVFSGPFVQQAPHLLVRWRRGYYGLDSDSIHFTNWLRHVPAPKGDHLDNGVLAAYGRGISLNRVVEGASIMDMAPTILHLLGLPVPDDMDGKVLTEIYDADFVAGNPVRYSSPSDVVQQAREDEDVYSDEDSAEIHDRLRALGYVD